MKLCTLTHGQRTRIGVVVGEPVIDLPAVAPGLPDEGELAFVVGKRAKHVPKERAHEVIAGYCCGNDVSVRDWQAAARTMQIGKSSWQPFLVTPDPWPPRIGRCRTFARTGQARPLRCDGVCGPWAEVRS